MALQEAGHSEATLSHPDEVQGSAQQEASLVGFDPLPSSGSELGPHKKTYTVKYANNSKRWHGKCITLEGKWLEDLDTPNHPSSCQAKRSTFRSKEKGVGLRTGRRLWSVKVT